MELYIVFFLWMEVEVLKEATAPGCSTVRDSETLNPPTSPLISLRDQRDVLMREESSGLHQHY